ncbi:copper chaperone PCu(A)C [Sphingomonas sp. QA11]|uniref:copper chaperone PCu(A)C n=1 Tax=Sphingomonas sp. QA11 TaxID=2950605 RepID=UPI002349DA1A|nr:copper chaperone PCu(A)C [Sphingomonas sp. QA11]WCM28113.1 copper chaperone PCu(A)C [Sphingomonas sp. QA11]
MMRIPALLCLLLALAGCDGPKEMHVSNAWVRLAAVPRGPAAAYFTLHGGPADATLISVSSDVSIRAEMHESMKSGSMSSMKPIEQVRVPAGDKIIFAPGGKHVMLFDVNPGIKSGAPVPLLFTFADGQRITYKATAVGAGDAAPGS